LQALPLNISAEHLRDPDEQRKIHRDHWRDSREPLADVLQNPDWHPDFSIFIFAFAHSLRTAR
jgi:hypothetical protein